MRSVEGTKRLAKPRLRGTVQVAVVEAVAVAFEGDDLGVVNESVDHGDGSDLISEVLAPGENSVLIRLSQDSDWVALEFLAALARHPRTNRTPREH